LFLLPSVKEIAVAKIEQKGNVMVASLNEADVQNPQTMEAFTEVMDMWQDAMDNERNSLVKELGVSTQCAGYVQYLRTRSRWTQEKEDQLIELDKKGQELPNVLSGAF
jgi:hypothetical protein